MTYKTSRDAAEEQALLKVLLENYLDGKVPSGAVVDLRQDGRFVPVLDVIRTYPHLVENRSVILQVGLVIGALLACLFLPWRGDTAFYIHVALSLAALVVALAIRSRPTLRGRSSGHLLRLFWNGPHRRAVLAVLGVAEAVSLVGTIVAARQRAQFRDQANAVVPTFEAAVQSDDPCAVLALDQQKIRDYAGERLVQQIRKREELCFDLRRQGKAPAQLAQTKERCEKIVAALKAQQPPGQDLLEGDAYAAMFTRLSQQKLELTDLVLTKDQLPCTGQGLWPLFVSAAQASPAWGTLRDMPRLDAPLRAELEQRKVLPSVVPAFKKNVEAMVAESQKQTAPSGIESAVQLCQLFVAVTTENSPTCKALESRYQALKAQEEQAAKLKAAQAAQQEKAKEARCAAITAQYQACNRRCDSQLFNGNDDAALQCEENCNKTFPIKDCP